MNTSAKYKACVFEYLAPRKIERVSTKYRAARLNVLSENNVIPENIAFLDLCQLKRFYRSARYLCIL